MRLILYQTLEDRNNPDHVEEYGPFQCKSPQAWLGYGYYFWDAHVELAHWWGKLSFYKTYMVCKARALYDTFCWDLHGNGMHRIEFAKICNEIVDQGISSKEKLLVPQVIEFFKLNESFSYESIRAHGINSINSRLNDGTLIFRMQFKNDNPSYLDVKPPVQVCLLKRQALSLQNYKVIHPTEYSEFYA